VPSAVAVATEFVPPPILSVSAVHAAGEPQMWNTPLLRRL
jgi:hypothetical protein